MYVSGDWESEEELVEEALSPACPTELRSMYSTQIEIDHTSADMSIEPSPVLVTNPETRASLAALARTAVGDCGMPAHETPASLAELTRTAVGDCGMPAHTQSLRQAMHAEFKGKKKVLIMSEVIQQQICIRCKKIGHTAFSCPDQTQSVAEDQTATHQWVRNLIDLPRVDIAKVNAGLSLEEGVRQWLIRGEEMNRGNPWAASTKKEDTLRKQLGYHKAMGMSTVHLGWLGFGVPLQFIQERSPRPLAFRNHKPIFSTKILYTVIRNH
jgi:hypothetical protein